MITKTTTGITKSKKGDAKETDMPRGLIILLDSVLDNVKARHSPC
jgi:hypothetical protein